jgi:hypothetical protein
VEDASRRRVPGPVEGTVVTGARRATRGSTLAATTGLLHQAGDEAEERPDAAADTAAAAAGGSGGGGGRGGSSTALRAGISGSKGGRESRWGVALVRFFCRLTFSKGWCLVQVWCLDQNLPNMPVTTRFRISCVPSSYRRQPITSACYSAWPFRPSPHADT